MNARNNTLLAMTLALGLPLATYAVAETAPAPSAAGATDEAQVLCPYYGGPGKGPGMMGRGARGGWHHGMGGMMMGDPVEMQEHLDAIKDPQLKAQYLNMLKQHAAYMESRLNLTKQWLEKQK